MFTEALLRRWVNYDWQESVGRRRCKMSGLILMLLVFVFVFSIGYFLIRRVPPLLHTPLMSMTNAISGVTLLGAILLFATKMAVPGKVLGWLFLTFLGDSL